jgi:hypothetical protein
MTKSNRKVMNMAEKNTQKSTTNNSGPGILNAIKNIFTEKTPRRTARAAGVVYLSLIAFGIIAQVIRAGFLVGADGAETIANIQANEWLFRIGFVSDLLMIMAFIMLPLVYYKLLSSVNKKAAALMVIFVLVSIPMMFVTMLFYLATLILATGPDYLTMLGADQLQALVMLFYDLYIAGVMINTIFHGLYLFPLGYLVYKSDYFPKVLGVLLMIACFGFLMQTIQYFLLPGYEVILYPSYLVTMIGEFAFCGYLLFRGVRKDSAEQKPVVEAASC